jgi:homoserine dehydrogenase
MLAGGVVSAETLVFANRSGRVAGFEAWPGLRVVTTPQALADGCEMLLLAIPPAELPRLRLHVPDLPVMSVMAGATVGQLARHTGSRRILRAMSSPAAESGLAFSPVFAAPEATAADRAMAARLLGACGAVVFVDAEAQIDQFTALTGPVPGFVAFFARCMVDHATRSGIAPDVADRAVRQLFLAAGKALAEGGMTPAEHVRAMIDYAGVTAAGLTCSRKAASARRSTSASRRRRRGRARLPFRRKRLRPRRPTHPESPMTRPLRIGLAGLGTVGAGVVKMLQAHGETIAARAGRPVEIAAISARSRHRDRGVDLGAYDWEDDPVALARRPDVDLVIEVMGGEDGPAKATAMAALTGGKHLVTANKALLARHGQALAEAAEAAGVALRFEAAVAGGVPVVKALTEGLAGNAITRVMGVLNGTCNYILTRMEAEDAPYARVLEEAQRLGYAEADPSFDVGGIDAAQKLALLAATAFGARVDFEGMTVEGIERVSLADIEHAAELGYRIKLLGVARRTGAAVEARTQPCLVPAGSPLGQLEGVTNMVVIEGDFVGRVVLSGPGAGEGPTASAILGDVIDIARGLVLPAFGRPAASLAAPSRAGAEAEAPYYLRFALTDAPGALAQVAAALGDAGISINRMRQVAHAGPEAPVLIVTHRAARPALDGALARIAGLEVSRAAPVAIRVEEV